MKKKVLKMTRSEFKAMMIKSGIEIKPSYKHEDYLFTSFTMPYPLKDKLDRLSKKYGVSRSGMVQLLISNFEE